MDILGNLIFIGSVTGITIALTFAGSSYSWTSWHVLVPLVVGILGLPVWVYVEACHTIEPTLPWEMLTNRSALSGLVTVYLHAILVMLAVCACSVRCEARIAYLGLQIISPSGPKPSAAPRQRCRASNYSASASASRPLPSLPA
jgi:hypothetical protein